MITIGPGAHGMSIIPDSISVGGEKQVPYQSSPDEAWLTTRMEIEAELGIPIETATQYGLQLRSGGRCRRRDAREWLDAIKSIARQRK